MASSLPLQPADPIAKGAQAGLDKAKSEAEALRRKAGEVESKAKGIVHRVQENLAGHGRSSHHVALERLLLHHPQNDLPSCMTLLAELVCLAGLLQRKHSADGGLHVAAIDQLCNLCK